MRQSFTLALILLYSVTFSQEKSENSRTKLKASGVVSINSNGIASIPAFSLNKPAVIGSFSLMKNRFSYDPVLAYSLEMKPWYIDNWLHYKIINKPKLEIRTGINFSTFFTEYETEEEELLKGERYFAYALEGTYRFSQKTSVGLMYWSDNGQEPGTISGHFINLVGDISDIKIGSRILMGVNVMVFYINYTGDNDGLFVSPKISTSVINVPFTLFFQATQSITSNIIPWPGFKWNIGLAYTL